MNTYLVTATFKNVALMGAAYDLYLKVIEDGTLNDEFEGFKVMEDIMPLTQIMSILLSKLQQA